MTVVFEPVEAGAVGSVEAHILLRRKGEGRIADH